MEEKDEIYDLICHYQKNLVRSAEKNNEEKMLYYINKLKRVPITVSYLQQTGVGKTVNSVRRMGGEVAKLAKSVISYWKEVVENESKTQRDEEEGYESETRELPGQKEEKHTKIKNDQHSNVSNSHHKHSHRENHKTSRYSTNTQEKLSRSSEKNSSIVNEKRDRKENQKQKDHIKRKHTEHEESNSISSNSTISTDYKSHPKSDNSKSSLSSKSPNKHCDHSSSNSKKERKSSDSKSYSKEDSSFSKKRKTGRSSTKVSDEGIDCGSGKSFAEALGMLEPSSSSKIRRKEKNLTPSNSEKYNSHGLISSPKEITDADECLSPCSEKTPPLLSGAKLEPLDINLSSLLPEITPHYRPLGNTLDIQSLKMKKIADYEALSAGITSKTQRTKVYSGNKSCWGVSSLFDMCIRVLQENIDALEYTGGVPYSILKPVLDRCTPDQLFMMEHYNPYLIEDTDELWKFHCQKEFRAKRREEMETWRDMYMRCLDEREAKLKALTSNIKQSQEKSQPVRQTMLAYVDSVAKPPRNVARKQVKNGIDNKPVITPSLRLSTLATSGDAGKVCVPNPGKLAVTSVNSGSSNHTSTLKPKKAPLMQKALALIKNRYRR